jgi:hypothetical protein
MSELFIIAKKRINATVVLPCIRQGRLMPCAPGHDPPLEGRDWNHSFTDVFQMDLIHDFISITYMQEEGFQEILVQNPSHGEYKFCHIR